MHITRTAGIAAAALVGVAALGFAELSTTAANASSSSTTMRFVAHDIKGELAFEDLGQPSQQGPDLGDLLAFTQRLTRAGKTVGRVSNVAVGVDHERHLFQATGTMALSRGDVEFSGLVSQTPHFRLAVTGGTGRYTGAGGWLEFDQRQSRQVLTLTLTR